MREVIDYSKDFLKNTIKTVKKTKEDTMYKGIATIQLFDENKNLIKEVKSTNCINKAVLSEMYVNMFKYRLLTNSSSPIYSNESPARWLLLTNNADEENPNYKYLKGEIIGYADGWNTYSGTDVLKGSLNTSETTVSEWNKHFVIDFPTHAANGTFQSIYWTSYFGTKVIHDESIMSGLTNIGCICANETFLFVCVMNNNNKLIKRYNLATKEINEIVLDRDIENCFCNETNLFIVGKDNIIYKYDLDGNLISACFEVSGNLFAYYNNEIIALNTTSNKLAFYNEEGTLIREYTLSLGNGVSIVEMYVNDRLIYLIVGSSSKKLIRFDIASGKQHNVATNYTLFWPGGDTSYGYMYGKDICRNSKNVFFHTNGIVRIGTDTEYFSHTTLPEPVTKTSASTMKIQYDFIVEPRGMFEIGDEKADGSNN